MDSPFGDFDSDYSSDEDMDHGFSHSDSESDSFDSDFDPEALKSHSRINTPRPSLTELQSILGKLNLDHEFMLSEELKIEMEIQQNNKTRDSFSAEDTTSNDTNSNTNNSTEFKTSETLTPQSQNKKDFEFKHTDTVSQQRIGKKWYINQYLCYKYLGKGSFGKVCLAKDIITNDKYAIKVLNKSILKRKRILRKNKPPTNMLENIFREIAIMKKLDHPNLIKIMEVIDDPDNDKLYMVIHYCNNGSVLGEQGAEAKCEPMKDHSLIRKYIRDMILGLDYLHANKIIHGDIKPENLLLSIDDHLCIGDFGVSFMLDSETCPNNDGKISRSQGTPAFTAPETGSKSFDAFPIDVWAMGVTLYMMVTGVCPFAGNGIYDTYEKIQSYEPPMDTLNIDADMKDFLKKILEKDPNLRITLKEAMTHAWITNNGTDPLRHPTIVGDKKFEKRVSVTKKDIEYAVNLPNNTIKHLRKASDDIDRLQGQLYNESKEAEESDIDIEQPPKKSKNKRKKPIKKLPSSAPPSQSWQSQNGISHKPSIKNKKRNSNKKYNPLTDSNSAKSIIVNMAQSANTVTYTNKPITIELQNARSNPSVSKTKKSPKKKRNLTPNPTARKPKIRKPSRDAPIAPKSKSKSKSPKKPKKPTKVAPKKIKKKKGTKKGPLSPKNKALPPSVKPKRKSKKKNGTAVEKPSNISPSFVKRSNSLETKRRSSKELKKRAKKPKSERKKNKNASKGKKVSTPSALKNKPLPKSKKKKQTKSPR